MARLLALALSGRLELAATATAAGALLILGERIMTTVNSVGDMYETGLFVEDFTTFVVTALVTHGATGTQPAPATFDRISVDGVTFTYPAASTPALRDVSLKVEAGQIIALVGENGSGKTTLAKLLSRLYLPDAGRIAWDGPLLDASADVEADGAVIAGGTPLDDAVAFGQWRAARRLVERGAHSKLFNAAALGLLDRVRDHLATDPPPEEVTAALWAACHGGQQPTAEYLLQRGAELNWIAPWSA